MRGCYEAQIQATGLTAGRTMIYVTAPSTCAIEILEASITPIGANVTNQNLEACLQRVSALGTPTGTSLTPSKDENGDQASGATAVGNVTASEPTYGNNTQKFKEGFSSLGGYRAAPIPEDRMVIPPSATVGLRLLTGSFTSADLNACLKWREIG
jgi:hypothetical protein